MSGAIHSLPQDAFMAWCLVKKGTGTTLPFTFTSLPNSYSLLSYLGAFVSELSMTPPSHLGLGFIASPYYLCVCVCVCV